MARAHDRDSGLGDRLHISAYIKDERRIVDLLQLRRIGGIVQADDGNSGCRDASHFVMRQFHGLTGAERLRRDGLNAGGLEFGQRGLENVLHAAEMLDQPPRPGGPEARGQGKSQPLQGEAFAGFRSSRPGLPALHHLHIGLTRGLLHPRKTMSRSHDTLLC